MIFLGRRYGLEKLVGLRLWIWAIGILSTLWGCGDRGIPIRGCQTASGSHKEEGIGDDSVFGLLYRNCPLESVRHIRFLSRDLRDSRDRFVREHADLCL